MMQSLRVKLVWSHILPTILLLPILSLYLLFTLEDFYIRGLMRQLVYQAELMRQDLENEAQLANTPSGARAFLDTIAPSTDSHVVLLALDGTILGSTRPEIGLRVGEHYNHPSVTQASQGEIVRGLTSGLAVEVAYVILPWTQNREIKGLLRLSYEVDDVRAQFDQLQWLIVSGSVITIAVALGLALAFATTITLPLRQLAERAKEIAAGNYSARTLVSGRDEIGLLADSFNQMTIRLDEMQRARERQLAAIAHELKRPITGMRATVEALRDVAQDDPAMRETLLAGTEEELTRLERLIGTLQGLQKRAVTPMQLNLTPVRIERAIRASVANFEAMALRAGITLAIEIPNDLPLVRADEDRLIQVMTNLLDNALKFTPAGGKISVQVMQDAASLRVTVADTGSGIAPEELPYIFQQFYRGGESRPPEKRGMGLGLAICNEIITAHQGKIWVESESGQGARFIFLLPKNGDAQSSVP